MMWKVADTPGSIAMGKGEISAEKFIFKMSVREGY
jgi:hypothetical protein